MTNTEIRVWYLNRVGRIPALNAEWIQKGIATEERARMAWELRHTARLEARAMMQNPHEIEDLRDRDRQKYGNPDGPSFDYLVERLRMAGLDDEALYEAIIDGSYRTDKELNRKLGL